MKPSVCNIIATYGNADIVKDCFDSCLNQTLDNCNVIFASRMDTPDTTPFITKSLIEEFTEYTPLSVCGKTKGKDVIFLRVLEQEETICIASALAIAQLKKIWPQYFMIISMPCILEPNAIEKCLAEIKNGAVAVYGDCIDTDIYIASQPINECPTATIGPFLFAKSDIMKGYNHKEHKNLLDFVNTIATNYIVSHIPEPLSKLSWLQKSSKIQKTLTTLASL